MKYFRYYFTFRVLAIVFPMLLGSACSSVTPGWPPTEEEEAVTIAGPLYIPAFESNYKYSQIVRQVLSSLQANRQKLTDRSTGEKQIKIKLEDWILKHKDYSKTWRRIQKEAKASNGLIDNSKLVTIVRESGLHPESHVLVIHVKTSVPDNPESVQLEGYRYLNLSEDEQVANMFRVSIKIKNRDARTALEEAIVNLITSNEYSSPSFDDIGFVLIREGCFNTGPDQNEEECVDDFRLSRTPVTQQQWASILKRNPALNNQGDSFPVTNISWMEIQLFLEELNDVSDREYRLPTEAEWEYACRNLGGVEQYGTPDGTLTGRSANFIGKSGMDTWASSSPVGVFPANKIGLHDMSGNGWEWTQDREHKRNFIIRFLYNYILFWLPEKPARRVLKGGSFDGQPEELLCSHKIFLYPSAQAADIGLRLVLEN